MSENLIKISRHLIELADEALKEKNLEETSSLDRGNSNLEQINSILNEAKKLVLDYSQELKKVSSKQPEGKLEIRVGKSEIREFAKKHREKEKTQKRYRVYKTNFYSKIANFFVENLSFLIARKYPDEFRKLADELTLSNIKILSRTYLSIMIFTSLIFFPIITALFFILSFSIWISLLSGLLGSFLIFLIIYKYPNYAKKNRAKLMEQELVFAFFHMSAVASSGAPPVNVFKLLLESGEYKFLQPEFERIINYINVFGYNLTSSLKMVALTSPSLRFRDFLYGMSSNIESGGGMRDYLESKSEDELVKNRLDQQKYLETVSTFSEIYIGILIAAPLLFIVTLAILERISPDFAGISINTIALAGVFGLLPLLNIIFILLFETTKVGK